MRWACKRPRTLTGPGEWWRKMFPNGLSYDPDKLRAHKDWQRQQRQRLGITLVAARVHKITWRIDPKWQALSHEEREAIVRRRDAIRQSLCDQGLSRRTAATLAWQDVQSLAHTANMSDHELLAIRNFGDDSLIEVRTLMPCLPTSLARRPCSYCGGTGTEPSAAAWRDER